MSFLRSGGALRKPKLTLRSLSELSRLRTPASDGVVAGKDRDGSAVLAQRVVCAMRRGDEKGASSRQE